MWSDDASPATTLLKSGVVLFPGSGTWASLSDRASKRNFSAIDPDAVLAKVERLPITEWSYRTEAASIRHVGPMAQDFYAAFGIGEDDRHITTIDEDVIALAAIKALAHRYAVLEADVRHKDVEVAELETSVRELQKDVAALMARSR